MRVTRGRVLRCILAGLVCFALIVAVDLRSLSEALGKLTLPVFLWLMLISVLLIYISALKWRLFLEGLQRESSAIRLFNLYLVGYFVNLLVPSYVGGDAVRSWYAGKRVGQHEALAATVLERYTGLVAMVVLAFASIWVVDGVTWQIKLAVAVLTVGVVGLTALALSPRLMAWAPQARNFAAHLARVREALLVLLRNRRLLVKTMALSFLFHSFTVVNTIAAGHAVGWTNPPVLDLFTVLPLVLLIGSLPLTPSGLGLQEGAFLFFLTGLGATPAEALGVGVVLRAKSYVLALFGGILWLMIRREGAPPVPDRVAGSGA